MRTLRFTALCLPLTSLLFGGCADPDVAGDEVGTETAGTETAGTDTTAGTESGTGTADDTTTTTTDTTDTTGETTTDTTGDTTTDTTGETTTTDTTDTTTGGGGLCEPAPGDDACTACNKENCCDELTTCLADEDCACAVGCISLGGDPFTCLQQCGVNGFPPALQALAGCTMGSCGMECGL